ncbi:ABC transporter ATP-binding protein [Candidatus Bipolaricaulota bacterium]|nr:ABC transporter ATP-binding protein [Candidatus Bipolaricaulota bacterium]
MDNILEVKDLELHYFTQKGVVKAVDRLSFDLKKGETLGVVGESGCGKTTMATALLKMPTPPGRIVGGQILLDGDDIMPLSETEIRRRVRWERISMVFQGAMNCLTPVYTIEKQMRETLQQHRQMDRAEAGKRMLKYLNLVGLSSDVLRRYPHELSGGMKQRVVIATALFLEPKVVICDEPTTALDVVVQAEIINLLKTLKEEMGLSFIFITHDLSIEAEVSDRIMVMYAGRAVEIGTNEQIYGPQGSAHPYTQRLLGATPRLHEEVKELSFIPGTPPDLLDPPSGCRFHPRCPVVMERCPHDDVWVREIEPEHMVACWRC